MSNNYNIQRIGYARISTDDQFLNLQKDALKKADCLIIYEEIASGKNDKRPELQNCLKALRKGDTLVVWRLDRLGRSLTDLVKMITDLEKKEICFESLNENIDTKNATGKLIFHIFGALAEFERNLIRERTQAGLISAKKRGRIGGRKPKLKPKQIQEIKLLLKAKSSANDLAQRYNVSRATIYNCVKETEN